MIQYDLKICMAFEPDTFGTESNRFTNSGTPSYKSSHKYIELLEWLCIDVLGSGNDLIEHLYI